MATVERHYQDILDPSGRVKFRVVPGAPLVLSSPEFAGVCTALKRLYEEGEAGTTPTNETRQANFFRALRKLEPLYGNSVEFVPLLVEPVEYVERP